MNYALEAAIAAYIALGYSADEAERLARMYL